MSANSDPWPGAVDTRRASLTNAGQMARWLAIDATHGGFAHSGTGEQRRIYVPLATASLAGALSAADKAILDLLATKDYAIAYHNTTQSIASGSATAVALNTEQADGAGFHDNATNNSRLTVPAGKGGLYLVGGAIRFNTAAAGTRRYLGLRANGTTVLGEFEQPATASFPTCFGAVVVFLSATEYVEMLAFQDSGGAVNLINSTNAWPKFWLVRLSG
jgi:hypothetical protein